MLEVPAAEKHGNCHILRTVISMAAVMAAVISGDDDMVVIASRLINPLAVSYTHLHRRRGYGTGTGGTSQAAW